MRRTGCLFLAVVFVTAILTTVYMGINTLWHRSTMGNYVFWLIGAGACVGVLYSAYISLRDRKTGRTRLDNLIIGISIAVLVLIILAFILVVLYHLFALVAGILGVDLMYSDELHPVYLAVVATFLGVVGLALVYGVVVGKRQYAVDRLEMYYTDLPEAFDGFTIAQISDMHAGTFDSVDRVGDGVAKIMMERPDMICFTGDLVNNHKDEVNPYLQALSDLDAPHGMYAVMGNHDYYGIYSLPREPATIRQEYVADFTDKHRQIGFQLLVNEHVRISKEDMELVLVGVENWGAGPFPKRGDLSTALGDTQPGAFTVLLSHDPTHWDHHVVDHPHHVHLTLSGHTHACQFGIRIGSWSWSPVKYRYPRWMGLYQSKDQYLYVNRGFGELFWPGRFGMSPEITLITLRKKA